MKEFPRAFSSALYRLGKYVPYLWPRVALVEARRSAISAAVFQVFSGMAVGTVGMGGQVSGGIGILWTGLIMSVSISMWP